MVINAYRVIVTGWRYWPRERRYVIENALDDILRTRVAAGQLILVRDGKCPYDGVDTYANEWALRRPELAVPDRRGANWNLHGRAAGPIRNQEMVDLGAELCLGFPETRVEPAKGSGTHDCMKKARAAGIPVLDFPFEEVLTSTHEYYRNPYMTTRQES